MKIHWSRILNAGLVAEILFVFLYEFIRYFTDIETIRIFVVIYIVFGGFVVMAIATLWVARKIESHFILHGVLVGAVAIVAYILATVFTEAFEPDTNYWFRALVGHPPKILGGMLGGYLVGRIKK